MGAHEGVGAIWGAIASETLVFVCCVSMVVSVVWCLSVYVYASVAYVEEEEDLFVFNDKVEGHRAPAAKPGRVCAREFERVPTQRN